MVDKVQMTNEERKKRELKLQAECRERLNKKTNTKWVWLHIKEVTNANTRKT
tara:strand:+ start:2576 stop:2731 length:156 start_codon:yes stop_codon:yes gene_type:complete